jgi:predicted SAM-dependent methyltransferase
MKLLRTTASQLLVNVGCGRTPTPGWVNLDNSWTGRLAPHPLILRLLHWFGLASVESLKSLVVVRREGILWADATRRLRFRDCTVSVLHTSHMVEHLDHDEVFFFLKECRRVLAGDGISE